MRMPRHYDGPVCDPIAHFAESDQPIRYFQPCSYGFRPGRRAQDAIAEVQFLASRSYAWVLDGDISACFDEIDHRALLGRVRHRLGDRRVLGLVKAFLRAGTLGEDGVERDTATGTPQGGILSPLLANIALSVLDEHSVAAWAAIGGALGRTPTATAPGSRHLPPRPLCGRLRGARGRDPRPRRGVARRGGSGVRADGPAPQRTRRRGSPISTRASTSWASASCGNGSEARASDTFTPTRPRLPSRRSRPRCGR